MPRRALTFLFLLAAFPLAAAPADESLAGPMRQVENLRGLRFDHAVEHRSIDRSELKERIREQMSKTMPYSSEDFAVVLQALQLVDKSSDLIGSMLKLYESQVLAFYDPLSHTYYSLRDVSGQTKDLGDPGEMADVVEIHELTHALQDQRFGAGTRDLALMKDTDAGMAYHSLLEGEATVVMLAYAMGKNGVTLETIVKNDSLVSQLTSGSAGDKSIDPDTPKYFSESLMFPYAAGTKLVLEAYRRGGWGLVNRMDENPPRSTREVIHYNEYFGRLDRKESSVAKFDGVPHFGLQNPLTVEHLGEFHWRFLVGDKSSYGWLDDRVTIAQDERCTPTVLVETTWQDEKRARNFREAYVAFLRKRGLEPVVKDGNGTTVRVAYGVDDALMERFVR